MRLAWATVFSVILLTGCGEELSVEQHIIAKLRAMETAAEEGEHFEFMGYVADSFAGQVGAMDRREFHRFMIFQLSQKRRLHAQFFPIHVTETGDTLATANFNLLVTGGKGLFPESGQLFGVKTQWLLIGNDWLLQKADWEAMRLTDKLPVN